MYYHLNRFIKHLNYNRYIKINNNQKVQRMKIGLIGLDTSHSIEFTKIIQGTETPEEEKLKELEIVSCMRFPSAFNSEESQDDRQAQLEKWGVKVTRSFEEAIEGVEGIMIEINDPALHLEYFKKVVDLGLPVFLDKPLSATLAEGKEIIKLAREKNIPMWSSSSLRYTNEIKATAEAVPEATFCNVFGPMGIAASGSSLVWYGIHSFEMLATLMGKGAKSVFARQDERGIVSIVQYKDGRRGIVECNEKAFHYGGRAQGETAKSFVVDASAGLYKNLLLEIRDFFINGTIPVSLDETLEIQAMMDAAERSLKSGKSEELAI
jgi:predicted dehydrogenase